MEPGHEDREYEATLPAGASTFVPQWSPVMKTGNTSNQKRYTAGALSLNGARS